MPPRNVSTADLRAAALALGYEVRKQIGDGGFKICYEATSTDGRPVAFKVLKNNAFIDRSMREFAVMQKCDHPNIARCIDCGTLTIGSSRVEFVVEELLAGGTLADQLAKGRLARSDVLRYGSDLLDAIFYLRDRRLVHRDIKPENLMFTNDGSIVLTDFGIVRALSQPSLTSTSRPFGWGTLGFMPAEQYHNKKPMIDWRADQFALGITLSLASLGQHPYGLDLRAQAEAISRCEAPTADFGALAAAAQLPVLIRMVQPYPIQRYSDPVALSKEWGAQSSQ
jgi:serine/threonine-protein kinase PpkA